MNFLAHLLLTDEAGLPLEGALLGDMVRGNLEGRFTPSLEASIRLHRSVDATTDAHPDVHALIREFPSPKRRYAPVIVDMLFDHCLALDWARYSEEPLEQFTRRASLALAGAADAFRDAGGWVPQPWLFQRLLLSYRREAGLDRALRRISRRLKRPEGLIEASQGWVGHIQSGRRTLPLLMDSLREVSRAAATEISPDDAPVR